MIKYRKLFVVIMTFVLVMSGCGKIASKDAKQVEMPTSKPAEEQTITTIQLTPEKAYDDGKRIIKFMGLKEYDKIETKKYKDIPKKGNTFLVLFLQCDNSAEESVYIGQSDLVSKVDGKEKEHTVIFNDPEGYTTFLDALILCRTTMDLLYGKYPKTGRHLT